MVDTHCHLDFPPFVEDLDSVISRAAAVGVRSMVTIGVTLDRHPGNLAVAERFDDVWCTVGIHPNEADTAPEVTVDTLIRLADHPKVIGFGETGLDYFHKRAPKEVQEHLFRVHIAAARETGLPLSIHSRDAIQDTADILREEYEKGPFKAVLHCFGGSPLLAEVGMELGLLFSIAGVVTFPNARSLHEIIPSVPLDRLVVETDAPYLTPVPHRGERNEPAYAAFTAARVATLKGVDMEEFRRASTDNFFRLFTKARRPRTAGH
nr:TatD family hydrolase [Phaeovibrio sulfidiphilus]